MGRGNSRNPSLIDELMGFALLYPSYGLETLQINPFDNVLKTHKLKGNLSDFYACRLNYEYRIVCIILMQDDEVILVDIGTHDDVY